MDEGLSIGELAGRAGVSVRVLRRYEAHGLLTPLRTAPTGQGARSRSPSWV
jgi:DNA-binding transcriptional MerR regulator